MPSCGLFSKNYSGNKIYRINFHNLFWNKTRLAQKRGDLQFKRETPEYESGTNAVCGENIIQMRHCKLFRKKKFEFRKGMYSELNVQKAISITDYKV